LLYRRHGRFFPLEIFFAQVLGDLFDQIHEDLTCAKYSRSVSSKVSILLCVLGRRHLPLSCGSDWYGL
jgi:hypothetical protein